MKLIIFGASGATGRQLVSQALGHGHHVTAFVRDPSKLPLRHRHLEIVRGNVANKEQVESAMSKQEAVLSALGVTKMGKHDEALIQGLHNIVRAMENENVKRLVYQSTFLVRAFREDLGFLVDRIFGYIMRNEIDDHEVKESIIRGSKTEHVLVRPSTLTNGPFTGAYRHGERLRMGKLLAPISRADVADFMLRQLIDDTYLYMGPRVMS